MNLKRLFGALLIGALFVSPSFADGDINGRMYGTLITNNATTTNGDVVGTVRFREVTLTDTQNGSAYSYRVANAYIFVRAGLAWNQSDLLTFDTRANLTDTGRLTLRRINSTQDTGVFGRHIVAIGHGRCDTSNFCWALISGVETGVLVAQAAVYGQDMVASRDAGFLSTYAAAINNGTGDTTIPLISKIQMMSPAAAGQRRTIRFNGL